MLWYHHIGAIWGYLHGLDIHISQCLATISIVQPAGQQPVPPVLEPRSRN